MITLKNLKSQEVKLLFQICEKLSGYPDRYILRQQIAEDLLCLLQSDFLASYVWNSESKLFDQGVSLNIDKSALTRYENYYQFRDPITPVLQKRRSATIVYEVMPKKTFEKTEFFNDLLIKEGLHHGINLHTYDRNRHVGDLRIWRCRGRPEFGSREKALLNFILPYFRNSLRNARMLNKTQNLEGCFRQLLEESRLVVFIFDEHINLLYQNKPAALLEQQTPNFEYGSLIHFIQSCLRKNKVAEQWKLFSLSVLKLVWPETGRPVSVVTVQPFAPLKIDLEVIKNKYHLSPRETEICLLVFKGLTDLEIASAFGISFHTVRTHLDSMFAKLEVTNRSELIYEVLTDLVDFS